MQQREENRRRRPGIIIVLLLALGAPLPVVSQEEIAETAETPVDPSDFQRVWYRTTEKDSPGKRFNLSGDLWFRGDHIEFKTRKQEISVPWSSVHVLSLGRTRWDVDTDWVLLAIGGPGEREKLIGFRDGRKLGYGGRTREMFEAFKKQASGQRAAQYAVPAGFRPFEDLEQQLVLAIPEDWIVHIESLFYVDGEATGGTVLFSSEPIRRPNDGDTARLVVDDEALSRIREGRSSAFFVDRSAASKGMGCEGFSPKASDELLARIARDAIFGMGRDLAEPPRAEPFELDGCRGLKILGRFRDADGAEATLDVRALAHRSNLYLFGLRVREADGGESRLPFETALTTVRFTAAY